MSIEVAAQFDSKVAKASVEANPEPSPQDIATSLNESLGTTLTNLDRAMEGMERIIRTSEETAHLIGSVAIVMANTAEIVSSSLHKAKPTAA